MNTISPAVSNNTNINSANSLKMEKPELNQNAAFFNAVLLGKEVLNYAGIEPSCDVYVRSDGMVKEMALLKGGHSVKFYEDQLEVLTQEQTKAYQEGNMEKGNQLEEKISHIQDKIDNLKYPEDPDIKAYRAQRDEFRAKMTEALENKDEELYAKYRELWMDAENSLKERREELEASKLNNQGFVERLFSSLCNIIPDCVKVLLPFLNKTATPPTV